MGKTFLELGKKKLFIFRAWPSSRFFLDDTNAAGFRLQVISPDFSLEWTRFFPGKHSIHLLVLKMKDFRNFVSDNCILVFDTEQVYLKLQITNLKNKKVTANPKPQTLEKLFFRKPYTLNPKHQICPKHQIRPKP